ncbi:Centrosomal protein of 70 kDa [Dissostichus eleginoides]|uniref:Centrosomal protein of 70 kDa n=1 Tax=Dissostichus eleginoides TaxID=100907 RepID=A0AAD9B3E9_DISEL|nr:Centrosomal protein of 70 kDa [Dissostichus eleginoides]
MDSRRATLLPTRNKTYVYLWTSRQFQEEQAEWDGVNKLLQHHGFKPVYFADPVENRNISDLILLDKKSAGEMRMTMRTMLTDSDRRQALIQELIKSNNELKEEVQEHMRGAAQQSQRATELEGLLDVVRTRVQDLEDRCLSKAVLEQKLSKQREEATDLQRKLYFTVKEEERRSARQSQTFQHICNKVSQQNSPADQQVLDVIDFYETKMSQLLDELRSVKGQGSQVAHQTGIKKTSGNVTPSFKTILKAYHEQQKGSQREIEELKKEVEPEERVGYKAHTQRGEGSIKHNNQSSPKEDIPSDISENINDQANLSAYYHHLLNDIKSLVSDPNAPLRLHRTKPSSVEFHTILPTLEGWAQQLHLLKGLNKLSVRLMPWQPSDGGHAASEVVKMEDMMLLVDTMLENTATDDEKVLRSPTRFTLGSMVSHFKKLFDVGSLSGVYPRMNEVYSRLGEATNTMRNLRDVLQLDSRVPPAEVVNRVASLVSSAEHTAGLHDVLGDADIDSIIVKVKQHEEFFPAFHDLILDILHTLGVRHLDDILPALRSLKHTD